MSAAIDIPYRRGERRERSVSDSSSTDNAEEAASKILGALEFSHRASLDDCADKINLRVAFEVSTFEVADYALTVREDGSVVGRWEGALRDVLPWSVRGSVCDEQYDAYPLVVKWRSIEDFRARGVKSLLSGRSDATLRYVAYAPVYVPLSWTPRAFVYRASLYK